MNAIQTLTLLSSDGQSEYSYQNLGVVEGYFKGESNLLYSDMFVYVGKSDSILVAKLGKWVIVNFIL